MKKNDIVILDGSEIVKSPKALSSSVSRLVDKTEDSPGFNWVYRQLDNSLKSSFWRDVRHPLDDKEQSFLDSIQTQLFNRIESKSLLSYSLGNHILLKPNTNNFKVWLHEKIDPNTNKTFWKSVRNKIGDPPSIIDTQLVESAAKSMQNYLYGRGYFDASVKYFISTDEKKSRIRYYAYNLTAYTIKSYSIESKSQELQGLMDKHLQSSFIKPGERLTIENYDKEKFRISNLVRNSGYVDFTPSNVSTLSSPNKTDSLDLVVNLLLPKDNSDYKRYKNGNIKVYINYANQFDSTVVFNTSNYKGIEFYFRTERSPIMEPTLYERIGIKKSEYFNQDDIDNTKRSLSSLGLYKYVYINSTKEQIDSQNYIHYEIHLSSFDKMTTGWDFDINTASNSSASQGRLLGTTLRTNYRNRNLFRGAEIWDSSVELGLEYALNLKDEEFNPISALNLKFQNDITLPGLKDWNGTFSLYERFLSNYFTEEELERNSSLSKSQISFAYDYRKLVSLYKYDLFSLAFSFDYNNPTRNRYSRIKQLGIYFFNPDIEPAFAIILQNNPVYERSFTQQLFTSFLLNELLINFDKPSNQFGESYSVQFFFETSGLEILAVDGVRKIFNDQSKPLSFINDIGFAKFIKGTISGSYLRNFGNGKALGVKIGTGIIVPLETSAPYVKSLYAGGANSVRAWAERELGPGGYIDTSNTSEDFVIPYQVGDFLFEIITEYRFPLLSYLKGAIFIDMGNVWSLNQNDPRPNSKLSSNFYKQIAIGSGFGARLDIDYAVIRFDVGQKIRLPHINAETNNNWAIRDWSSLKFNELNYNLAIGYPF